MSPLLAFVPIMSDGTTLPHQDPAPRATKPACADVCTKVSRIDKSEVVSNYGCQTFPWQVPHMIEDFQCIRYQCGNGYNYAKTAWTGNEGCTDQDIYTNPCPDGSCTK